MTHGCMGPKHSTVGRPGAGHIDGHSGVATLQRAIYADSKSQKIGG